MRASAHALRTMLLDGIRHGVLPRRQDTQREVMREVMHSEIEQSEPTAPSSEQAAKDGKPAAAAEGADRAAPLHGVVEEVLRRALRGVEHVERADGDVRAALRLASTAAQSRGLHAEQLLVLLKEGWRQLPEAQRMALRSRADADAALARMITLCIEEYYAPSVRQ